MNKKRLVYWVSIGVVLVGLLAYVAVTVDFSILQRVAPGSVAPLVLLAVVVSVLDVLQIWVLLWGMGHQVSVFWLAMATISTLWLSFMTPTKVGIPVRVYLFRKMFGVPVGHGTAAVLVGAVLSLLVSGVAALIGVLIVFDATWLRVPLAAFMGVLLLGISALFVFSKPLDRWGRTRRLHPKIRGVVTVGLDLLAGLRTISPLAVTIYLVLAVPRLIVPALNLQVILSTLGVELPLGHLVILRAVSRVMGFVSMMPMGLGAQEATLVALLNLLGSPSDVTALAAVMDRFVNTGIVLILGVIATSVMGPRLVHMGADEGDIMYRSDTESAEGVS